MEIWGLLKALEDRVDEIFGDRLVCLGLRGSFARGEATEVSDIDAVLILDTVSMEDLFTYREILRWLPHPEKVCGFVAGKEELGKWDRSELFQFCMDTQPICGSLDFAKNLVQIEDVRRAVHRGACDMYQKAVHGMLHKPNMAPMIKLYKAAFFVLQMHYYVKTGLFIRSYRELAECVAGSERQIVYDAMALKNGSESDGFENLARRIIEFSSALIREYGDA